MNNIKETANIKDTFKRIRIVSETVREKRIRRILVSRLEFK